MKKLFFSYLEADHRKTSFILLLAGIILAAIAGLMDISKHPPAIIIALLATCALVLSFTHHWRMPRTYLKLLAFSLIFFILSVILHNGFEAIGQHYFKGSFLEVLFNVIGVFFFLAAIFFCPAAFLIGAGGAAYTYINKERSV